MDIKEVPRDQWDDFFESFSRQHEGWLASVSVHSATGAQVSGFQDLPLSGIAARPNGGSSGSISIVAGREPAGVVIHEVRDPEAVELEETERRAHRGLRIRPRSGNVTVLEFRTSVPNEMLNGG